MKIRKKRWTKASEEMLTTMHTLEAQMIHHITRIAQKAYKLLIKRWQSMIDETGRLVIKRKEREKVCQTRLFNGQCILAQSQVQRFVEADPCEPATSSSGELTHRTMT